MNLFEVSDEFATPKTNPAEDLVFLEKKEKALIYQIELVRKQRAAIEAKIVGEKLHPTWNQKFLSNPEQAPEIQKVVDAGWIAVTINQPDPEWSNTVKGDIVEYFIKKIPENEQLLPKLKRVLQREASLHKMRRNIPSEVKRAKTRMSAWKRKQPTYVSRTTGKELLVELRDKIQTFLSENHFPAEIGNNYYWAKNKMIVIEINCRTAHNGLTSSEFARQEVKPMLTKFLEELGYTQFRCTDRFLTSNLTIIKLQLDDVEAKNKATKPEVDMSQRNADQKE